MCGGDPNAAATLTAPMRTVLLATLALLIAAPAASAATTVSIRVSPSETQFGSTTTITGTLAVDGAAVAAQPVTLEGRPYPYGADFAPVVTGTTGPDGRYTFAQHLRRNWQFRVAATGATSKRVRAYVFPATTLTFKARSSRAITLTQRYHVPKGVRLEQPTIFYVGKRGRKTAPRAATGKLKRVRAGRYTSSAVVHLPAAWKGRFRYASCFRYTGGSGMGNPRASCPKRFRF
jgi:hypothetical protein